MLKGTGGIQLNIQKTYNDSNNGIYIIGKDQNSVDVTKTTTITAGIILTDYTNFWNSLKVNILESDGGLYTKRISELTSNPKIANITLNNISADPYATILQFFTTKETANYIKVAGQLLLLLSKHISTLSFPTL